jgi:hypothetical protein
MMNALRVPLLLIFLASLPAHSFNHPELTWRTVATRHFLIHYYDRTEPAVFAASKIAEESYDALAQIYSYRFVGKINLSLADYDDFSNGFAEWTARNITIWVPEARFELRGNNTWLRNVITHEIAHIISLEKHGAQLLAWQVGASYRDSSIGISAEYPVDLTAFYPNWFVEGLAQLESRRAGNDCWDSRRDMILRCSALDNRMLSLSEMGVFNHDNLGNEMVYNQGFSFASYIDSRFGTGVIAKICDDARQVRPGGADFAERFAAHAGVPLTDAWRQWRDSLKAIAAGKVPAHPTPVNALWSKGTGNLLPKFSPDGTRWGCLTTDRDDGGRTDLIIGRSGDPRPAARVRWASTAWCFSSDGSKIYYVKARMPDDNGSFFNNIYSYEPATGRHQRITTDARMYDIEAMPGGKFLCGVRFFKGEYSIVKFDLHQNFLTSIIKGTIGEPFQGLSACPGDGNRLVTARLVNGQSDIFAIDLAAKTIAPICTTAAQEESPFWAADGRIYFSADYDGIFNVYSMLPDGSDRRRHSSVTGGLFQPCVGKNGTILASEYASAGFRIVSFADTGLPDTALASPACTFQALPRPKGQVRINSRLYEPDLLRRTWQMLTLAYINDPERLLARGKSSALGDSAEIAVIAGAASARTDALHKRSRVMQLLLMLGNGSLESVLSAGESEEHSSARFTMRDPAFVQNESERPGTMKGLASEKLWRQPLKSIAARAQADSSDSAAPDAKLDWLPVFQPLFSLENASFGPTIGMDLTSYMVGMIMPEVTIGQSRIDWQLSRALHFQFAPAGQLAFFATSEGPIPILFFALPAGLIWQDYGYIEKDVAYTQRGLIGFQVMAEWYRSAGLYINSDPSSPASGDTTGEFTYPWLVGGAFMYGIPLGRHSSLVVNAEAQNTWYSRRYFDPEEELDGASNRYFTGAARLSLNAPIIRNINRGSRFYAEGLFGEIFYDFSLYANSTLFDHPSVKYFSSSTFDTANVDRGQIIGAGLTLGMTKSYMFSQVLSLKAGYDIWRKKLHIGLHYGF